MILFMGGGAWSGGVCLVPGVPGMGGHGPRGCLVWGGSVPGPGVPS